MATLAEMLLTEENRPRLIRDCQQLIEAEVADKKGVSGLAIKAGFKTVKAVKRGIIPDVIDFLLDDFVGAMEPHYADFKAAGEADFPSFAARRGDRIAHDLLGITDRRAAASKHRTLVKAYHKLRPQAHKQVMASMPRLGRLLASYGV